MRGFEGGAAPDDAGEDDERENEEARATTDERLWLIQCKREKAIGPKKLAGYLDAIPVDHANRLYGIIFAAACDFPKRHAVYSAQSRAPSLWPHRRHLLYGRDRSRRGHGHGRAGGRLRYLSGRGARGLRGAARRVGIHVRASGDLARAASAVSPQVQGGRLDPGSARMIDSTGRSAGRRAVCSPPNGMAKPHETL